ncbi:MAG: DNRLRE domain-containing protein [Actinomycetia bacterium]|nr:DNRLRE domain-containing protein [Actinomycetes bacterium]
MSKSQNLWFRTFCVLLSVVLVIALIPASAVATPKSTAVPSQEASTPPLGSGEATYGAPADANPDPAAEVRPQAKDPHATRVREIIEDRTPTAKTYELSDGRRQILDSVADLHYKNASGHMVDISTNLIAAETTATPGTLTTLSTKDKTSFSAKGTGAATISGDGYSLSLTACGASLSQPMALGDTALYLDSGDDTSLSYQALRGGLKETLLLNNPNKTKDFYDFRLDFTGLTLRQNEESKAFELIKSDGSIAYGLADLVVTDSSYNEKSGNSSECPNTSWELISSSKTSARFRACLDKDWLSSKERIWPIKIDPSVTVGVALDTYVGSGYATSNYNTSAELRAGYYDATTGINRSYLKFNALPSLPTANVDSVTLSAYQQHQYYVSTATTSYVALASAAIGSAITWNTKPAMSAGIASTSITGRGVWASYNVTSSLKAPINTGAAFYGLVFYQSEASPTCDTWRKFNSAEGTYPPYLTITYSTKVAPVANLTYTQSATDTYFREADKNGDGIADNKNDYPDAGRGSVGLSWTKDPYAAGYHIYAYDGANYRQVGTTLGNSATTWSSAGAGIYPTDTTIAGYGANGSYSGNPYTGAASPSAATYISSSALTYPSATPYNAKGSAGSGVVVPSGKYLYVRNWSGYPGPSKWVRYTQNPSSNPNVPTIDAASAKLQATADTVPDTESAFVLNGVLYEGAVTAATATSTTVVGYAESTFESSSAHGFSFTFDKPLLGRASGADIAAGSSGSNIVLLTTDGACIYSVGQVGQGFKVRKYSDTGHFLEEFSVAVANTTNFASFDGIGSDGNNLYLYEWTATSAARTYKVSLASHLLTGEFLQTDQASRHIVTFAYDFTYKRFVAGNLDGGSNVFSFRSPGMDLRDNPSPLYGKQKTTYLTNINYWFRVAAFDAYGETAIGSAPCAMPTLENRTIRVSDNPSPSYAQLGSVAGLGIDAAEGRPATQITTTDLSINSWGPDPSVSRTYTSDMASTSAYLPKGWRFSFEKSMIALPTGAVQYSDDTGQVCLFAQDSKAPNTYISPAGMFSTLTKTSSGYTLTDADRTQHTFGSDGKITSDIDRNGNKTTYSYPSGGVSIQAANGQKLTLTASSAMSYTLTLEGVSTPKIFSYAISGNNLTVTEYKGTPREVVDSFVSDSIGRITSITRAQDSAVIAYGTSSVYFTHTAAGAPPVSTSMTYSKRSTNVSQSVLDRGSETAAGRFAAGQEKKVFLTDPSGQEIWASTSANQLYGTNTSYNAYNLVIYTKDPVSASNDGLSFADCPATVGTVGATKSDYDSRGNCTYTIDKAGLETFNYYNDTNDLIKTISNDRAVTWYEVDAAGQILVTEKLIAANGARSRSECTYDSRGLTLTEKTAISKNADGTYVFDEKNYSNFAANGEPQKTTEKSVQLSLGATPQDITTSCMIDEYGNTLSNTDGRGIVTDTSTYDVAGSVLTSTDKTGLSTTNTYNSLGNTLETYQVPSGSSAKYNWTKTAYDAENNTLSVSNLDTAGTAVETTVKTLDCLGRESASDSNSEQGNTKTTYDLAGSATTSKSEGTPDGVTTTVQYDANGQEIKSTDDLTSVVSNTTYDASGNVVTSSTTGQPTENTTYDISGNATSETSIDSAGTVLDSTESDYDLDGNVISSTESASGKPAVTTTYTYDLAGNLLSTQMGGQQATTNTYNVRGEMLSTTDFDAVTTLYTYDEAGNQISEKVGTDNPTTKTYDSASRITRQVNPDGTQIDYSYDILSRVSEQKESKAGTVLKDTTTTYDSAGRVSKGSESVSGYSQSFSYQNTGSGTTAQTVTTKTETYNLGLLPCSEVSVTNGSLFASASVDRFPGYQVANTAYDAGGRPTTQINNTYTTTLSYNEQGNLENDTNLSAPGEKTYSYDTKDSKLIASNYSKLGQSASYTYSADRTQLASAATGAVKTNYAYNLTTGDITTAGSNGYTYNAQGRLATRTGAAATYSYDSLGRRTSGAGNSYSWAGQRLISATGATGTATYVYDGQGQRLSKQVGSTKTSYVYDGIKLFSLKVEGSSVPVEYINYVYGSESSPKMGIYTEAQSSAYLVCTPFQIVSDTRGDVRELRDSSGAVFARYDYNAYGGITLSQVFATSQVTLDLAQRISNLQPLRYAGYVWDAESGLYYCSARYYDPGTASFISRDPAKADGEKSPYLYCAGEPVGGVDPTGQKKSSWARLCAYSKCSFFSNELTFGAVGAIPPAYSILSLSSFALSLLKFGGHIAMQTEATKAKSGAITAKLCITTNSSVAGKNRNPVLILVGFLKASYYLEYYNKGWHKQGGKATTKVSTLAAFSLTKKFTNKKASKVRYTVTYIGNVKSDTKVRTVNF